MADKNHIGAETLNRQHLIGLCHNILSKLEKKINGRYRPSDNENLYLQTIRAITALIDTSNRVIKDHEIDDLERRLQAIENQQTIKTKERIYD